LPAPDSAPETLKLIDAKADYSFPIEIDARNRSSRIVGSGRKPKSTNFRKIEGVLRELFGGCPLTIPPQAN
jgi:hypothetical protein